MRSCSAGAQDVGEAIALAADVATASAARPDGLLAHIWRRFSTVRIEELLSVEFRLEAAWASLLEFSERELRILEARCPTHPARSSLATLGDKYAVTRERVRQIDLRCRRTIAARLQSHDCIVIMHHATRLRRTLGTLVPATAVDVALQPLLPCDTRHPLLCRDIVLDQAGPYRFEDGFWQTGRPLGQITAALSKCPGEQWTDDRLDRLMDDAGIAGDHRAACRAALRDSSR